MSSSHEFGGEQRLVNALEKAWANLAMEQKSRIDNVRCNCLTFIHLCAFVPS